MVYERASIAQRIKERVGYASTDAEVEQVIELLQLVETTPSTDAVLDWEPVTLPAMPGAANE